MPIAASEYCDNLLSGGTKTITDDWTWKVFGYKKRPKRGVIFNRFIGEGKLIRETFLIREFFIIAFSTGLLGVEKSTSTRNIESMMAHAVDKLLDYDGIAKAFRFSSNKEAKDYLIKGILDYINSGYDEFTSSFFSRAKLYTEKYFTGAWLVYAVRLFTDTDSMVQIIKKTNEEILQDGFEYDLE